MTPRLLVLGAGGFLGRSIVHHLADTGDAELILHSRRVEDRAGNDLDLECHSLELLNSAPGALADLVQGSVAKREQVTAMFTQIRAEHGHLDVLINNAASGALRPLDQLDDRDWERTFDTNLKGSLWCAQQAVDLMSSRGGGSIVNLSSIGAGLVLGGRLHRGANGTAGEIGHDIVDEAGPYCRCGNRGCLEAVAGGSAITEVLSRSRGEQLSLGQVLDLAEDGDLACRRVLAEVGRQLGVSVAKLCNLVNPERVVLGGLLARAGDLVLEPMRASVRLSGVASAMDAVAIAPRVLVARAGGAGPRALVLRGRSQRVGRGAGAVVRG